MRKAIKKVGIKTHFEYILNKFPHFVLTLLPINIVNQVRSGLLLFTTYLISLYIIAHLNEIVKKSTLLFIGF